MTTSENLLRLNRLYAVSSGINEALVRVPDVQQLYQEACRIAVERGNLLMAWVGLRGESRILTVAAKWGKDEGYLAAIRISTSEHEPQGRGPAGEAFRTGRPAVCNDIASDTYFFASKAQALARGFRSCAAFPLKIGGVTIGVFIVYAAQPLYFDSDEMALLLGLSENFSFAIEARQKETQRRQMEAALRASEARLRAVIDNEPECVKSVSLAGLLMDINPAGLRMIQADTPSAVLGQPVNMFILPSDRPAYALLHAQVCDGRPGQLQFRAQGQKGKVLWMDTHGVPLRAADGRVEAALYVTRDVTQQKESSERIAQLAQRLETTLESITDALVAVDHDWIFTYVNHEAERLLRRSRHELLGTNMWVEFPQGRGTEFEKQYLRAQATGQAVEFDEYFAPLEAWFEIRVYPSSDGGLTIYFRDITERRRHQSEVLRLNAELELRVRQRTAQLEMANHELEAFSYSVAHDLRAPLAAISGFGHALEHELAQVPGDRVRHYLGRMREGARQTQEMIDALLSLAQLSQAQLRWEPVDLSAMALAALESLRDQAPQRRMAASVAPGLTAQGDPRLLQLVLDNLLGNAWKFTAARETAQITLGNVQAPGETVFFVRDNGVGFDMDYSAKLFGAFQRLHAQSEFPGTGIGLANVRRIIARHGGRVWADSRPGAGATFYFTLGIETA